MAAHEDLLLTPEQLQYLDWLTTPRHERRPSSKQKYAREHGHDVTTLRRWEKREQFAKELESRMRYLTGGAEKVKDALDKLYDEFMESGDHRKLELWLRATGNLKAPEPERVETKVTVANLTDSEFEALFQEQVQRERARRAHACRKDYAVGSAEPLPLLEPIEEDEDEFAEFEEEDED